MGATGLLRPNASITYTCQPAPDWGVGTLGQSTTDIKHIDADGNAMINNDDTLAIVQNWGQIHLRGSGGSSSAGVPLYVDTLVANPGDTLHLPILLGDATNIVTDAYGLAYSIDYDQTNIKANSVYVTYDNSWMGTNLNTLNLQKDFYAQGELETALTRTTQIPISGFGQIGTLHLIIKDVVSLGGMGAVRLDFEVRDVTLIDHLGNLIPVDNKLTQVLVVDPTTSATMLEDKGSSIRIVPNPASYHLDISTTDQYIEKVVLYASDGRRIKTQIEAGQINELRLNLEELPSGLYVVTVQTNQKVYNRQIIIKR
ncbi:MAG: T9SS type A sorting domain-containing protein [Aureispira sp.]|nr:T9SS type A sorting domain-containing protein [Aureispira sp.]